MARNDITAARLDLIAAKARILADQYKNNQLWDGELEQGLSEISSEIGKIGRSGSRGEYRGDPGGVWYPDDK